FSSAVSDEEVDIGVETYEEYRRNGLAGALAQRMCEEITADGRRPVWSHAETNIGSGSTALKCGFKEERRVTTCQTDRN
ncbi:MAG: GNAT family N-acetyltransferase, partial [Saccharofermentans sp.]|nr:GNAT family N-acetyltransferase [Saccharofermentans sp.]